MKNVVYYLCTEQKSCLVDKIGRNKCQFCRFQKCIALGMSKDAMRTGRMSATQRAKLGEEINFHKSQNQMQGNFDSSTNPDSTAQEDIFQSDLGYIQALEPEPYTTPHVQSVQVTGRPPVQTPTIPTPGVYTAQPTVSTMPPSSPAATPLANPTIQSAVSSSLSTQPTAVSTSGQPQQLQQQQKMRMQVPLHQQQQMQQQQQQMRMQAPQQPQQQPQQQWQGQMRQPQPQQQGQFVNPNTAQVQGVIQPQQSQQQQQWTPAQQQQMLQHRQRQQQIIQQHISTLSMEERRQFSNMDGKEKQQYLSERNLLLPQQWNTGQQVQLQRHTIQLTEQQRLLLENMNPQQRAIYLQKLRGEKEAQLRQQQQQQMLQQRQQMLIQQQQQQHGGQQQIVMQQGRQQMVMAGQQPQVMMHQPQQQMMQQQQQPNMMQQQQPNIINQQGMVQMQQQPQQQQQWGGATPTSGYPQHSSPAPMSPIQQMGNLSPGHVSPNRMPSPVQNPGLRQAWSGDPHPALAQVPRTPQQIQHLQRLHMQRQQVEGGNTGEQQGMMQQNMSQPCSQQQMIIGGQPTNTKVALQNMLSSRIGPGGQPIPSGPGQIPAEVPQGPNPRMQMMNQQMQQGGMMQQQAPQSPQQIQLIQQQQMQQQQQRQQQLMALQQQRAAMVSPGQSMHGLTRAGLQVESSPKNNC